jgi:hypothetical protein
MKSKTVKHWIATLEDRAEHSPGEGTFAFAHFRIHDNPKALRAAARMIKAAFNRRGYVPRSTPDPMAEALHLYGNHRDAYRIISGQLKALHEEMPQGQRDRVAALLGRLDVVVSAEDREIIRESIPPEIRELGEQVGEQRQELRRRRAPKRIAEAQAALEETLAVFRRAVETFADDDGDLEQRICGLYGELELNR